MEFYTTKYLGIGIGIEYEQKFLSIHFIIWCLDITFKKQ